MPEEGNIAGCMLYIGGCQKWVALKISSGLGICSWTYFEFDRVASSRHTGVQIQLKSHLDQIFESSHKFTDDSLILSGDLKPSSPFQNTNMTQQQRKPDLKWTFNYQTNKQYILMVLHTIMTTSTLLSTQPDLLQVQEP